LGKDQEPQASGDEPGDGGVSMTTTLDTACRETGSIGEVAARGFGPAERDEIERLLENLEAALQSLDDAWPGTGES